MFEAFQFGPMTIWLRVVFLLIAVWVSSSFFFRLASSAGFGLQSVRDDAKYHLIAFLLCGRILVVISSYQTYLNDWLRIFIFWDGGFSFLGGSFGIALVLFWSTRKQRTTFLQWLDVLFPATTLGLALDWFGMFLSSQAYGKPTNAPWGIVVNSFNVGYTVPIHPVQLYYAFFYLILTFLLLLIRKHAKRAGAETLLGIIASTVAVFFFEFFRGDSGIPAYAMFTDFIFLTCLISSLGLLAIIEQNLTERVNAIYGIGIVLLTFSYVIGRTWIDFPQYQLRFSQVLSILALLTTVVYVTVHRRKYPHL
jgi:prolipoprotein diacylglyceryl transferase